MRTGRLVEAEVAFSLAIGLSQSYSEKLFLARRTAACEALRRGGPSADPETIRPAGAADTPPPD
ncbi:hypothetical protein E2A64_00695 [Pseudohoeflea suaedae]|uniref:Uncharacterized protein n=1 Tax=Pseudohoeflea suaedae TaxID=877384 RepID=A0A4R5PLJ7_9HYPH|nr:hypothetical protein [Pseudohoeflea suaedae]TDH37698.1 hypothetical protein E2A64_00695 [Pseudohoeflea suaedae]